MPRRILAMDGGGILSLLSLTLLRRIEGASPGFLASADLLAGTSAGGINALLLASREDPREALDLCLELWDGDVSLYKATALREGMAVAGSLAFTSNKMMKAYLEACLGDMRLGDLHRQVAIPTFDLQAREGRRAWGPRIFANFGPESGPDLELRAVDVGIATSAFPVSFPVHGGYIDGGIYANNPAMCALSHALRAVRDEGKDAELLDEVVLLSVGTGHQPQSIEVEDADWGWGRWLMDARHPIALVEAMLDATQEVVDYQCREILGDARYFRLDPPMEQSFSLTEERGHRHGTGILGKAREHAEEMAESADLTEVLAWLEGASWTGAAGGSGVTKKQKKASGGAKKRTAGSSKSGSGKPRTSRGKGSASKTSSGEKESGLGDEGG